MVHGKARGAVHGKSSNNSGAVVKKEMIKLLSALIAEDTTNPPGNEWRVAGVVKRFFSENGIKYRMFEKQKGRTNIIGYIGSGRPRLLLACHMDTVPAGDGWVSNPFHAKVDGDMVYGRGAVDDKGPLAGVLIAAKMIKAMEPMLCGQVIIACVADEEAGSKVGMEYLLDECDVDAEYAIVPDIDNQMHKIDVAEKGLIFLKVTSLGKQAHGSCPDDGVNAILAMNDFLELLRSRWGRMRYRRHPLLSQPTLNVGMVRGGEAVNMVPAKCEARLDMRYLPSQKPSSLLREVRMAAYAAEKRHKGARFVIEKMEHQKPVEVGGDNALVKSIRFHTKAVTGRDVELIGISGTTLMKPLASKGITAVGFSPGKGLAHMANEYISVSELVRFSRIVSLVCLEVLK